MNFQTIDRIIGRGYLSGSSMYLYVTFLNIRSFLTSQFSLSIRKEMHTYGKFLAKADFEKQH